MQVSGHAAISSSMRAPFPATPAAFPRGQNAERTAYIDLRQQEEELIGKDLSEHKACKHGHKRREHDKRRL